MFNSRPIRGRGTADNPPNRFEPLHVEPEPPEGAEEVSAPATVFLRDSTRSVISRNESPDVGFSVSLNPYRGCEHGCAYCYARPTHEYLGFSAGLDFETKILVKEDAPALLRAALASPRWTPQTLGLSGVTDPYQPIERRLRITRRCLEVLRDFRQPVHVITKNHLVTRDADLLGELACHSAAAVCLSVTTLDDGLHRVMEPRTSPPRRRLEAIAALARAGVPVGVMVAPVIPGLTDHEMPAILAAAAQAGARWAGYVLLRLPLGVAPLFGAWLAQHFPGRRAKILNRLRAMHGGRVYDSRFSVRQRGTGVYADGIEDLFLLGCRRAGLSPKGASLSGAAFRRGNGGAPGLGRGAQLSLLEWA